MIRDMREAKALKYRLQIPFSGDVNSTNSKPQSFVGFQISRPWGTSQSIDMIDILIVVFAQVVFTTIWEP